ncbi:MAG: hypothetical protein MZV65_46355 [Chromatiales bacterium]|nr:hypothetical protein [Chromatiales bacterium]
MVSQVIARMWNGLARWRRRGLEGLRQVCERLQEQLGAITRQVGALEAGQRELLEEWPGLTIGYLETPAEPGASEALVGYLQNPAWPTPLSETEAAGLFARLTVPWSADSKEETAIALQEMAEATEPVVAWMETSETAAAAPVTQPEVAEEVVMVPALLPEEEGPPLAMADDDMHVPPASLDETLPPSDLAAPISSGELVAALMTPADAAIAAETACARSLDSTPDKAVLAPAETDVTEPMTGCLDLPAPREKETVSVEAIAAAPLEPEAEAILPEAVPVEAEAEPRQSLQRVSAEAEAEAEAEPAELATVSVEAGAESLEPETALVEAEVEPAELATVPVEAGAESLEPEAAPVEMEPESLSELEETSAQSELDQELVELLLAEVGLIEEAGTDIKTIATAPDGEVEARYEALLGHAEEIARLADAAEAMGFIGLQQVCVHLHGNELALASRRQPLTNVEYELIAGWPARAGRYLLTVADRDACQDLVDHLQNAGWPNPLPTDEADALIDLLVAPTPELPEVEGEARPARRYWRMFPWRCRRT